MEAALVAEGFRAGRADVTDVVPPPTVALQSRVRCARGNTWTIETGPIGADPPSVHRRPRGSQRETVPFGPIDHAIRPRRLDGALRRASGARGRHSEERARRDPPASLRPPKVV